MNNITFRIIVNPVLLDTDTLHPIIREQIARAQAQHDEAKTGYTIAWVHLYRGGDLTENCITLQRVDLPDGTVDWRRVA